MQRSQRILQHEAVTVLRTWKCAGPAKCLISCRSQRHHGIGAEPQTSGGHPGLQQTPLTPPAATNAAASVPAYLQSVQAVRLVLARTN
jgi:hypothetical protein